MLTSSSPGTRRCRAAGCVLQPPASAQSDGGAMWPLMGTCFGVRQLEGFRWVVAVKQRDIVTWTGRSNGAGRCFTKPWLASAHQLSTSPMLPVSQSAVGEV
jgi:hypothetical protein